MHLYGGRKILDPALVANEVVEDVRRGGRDTLVFKLDFGKACDWVSWASLDRVMERKWLGSRSRGWVRLCFRSSQVSMFINRKARDRSPALRGL